eukprot:1266779-Pyramimonas_sp.AAC.1
MKTKRLAGRVSGRLYYLLGSRWPAFSQMLSTGFIEWKQKGCFVMCEPNENGIVAHIRHISGAI